MSISSRILCALYTFFMFLSDLIFLLFDHQVVNFGSISDKTFLLVCVSKGYRLGLNDIALGPTFSCFFLIFLPIRGLLIRKSKARALGQILVRWIC